MPKAHIKHSYPFLENIEFHPYPPGSLVHTRNNLPHWDSDCYPLHSSKEPFIIYSSGRFSPHHLYKLYQPGKINLAPIASNGILTVFIQRRLFLAYIKFQKHNGNVLHSGLRDSSSYILWCQKQSQHGEGRWTWSTNPTQEPLAIDNYLRRRVSFLQGCGPW